MIETDPQRRYHLQMLTGYLRRKLEEAYPDGVPPDASRLLEHGDQIVAAIKRIDSGHYGECIDCRRPIPLLQLWAEPHTLRCRCCEAELGRPEKRYPDFVL